MALLSLIPILGYAFFIHIFLKKLISTSLFFSITFIIFTLFLFGVISQLIVGANLLFFIGFFLFAYTFFYNQKDLLNIILQPPLFIFILSSVVVFFTFQDAHLFFWDEFSHWGAFIKEMYYFHDFYDTSSVAAHINYPPGISLWDYFILLNSSYNEGNLYFAYFLILCSSTLMMYEKIPWKKWYWIMLVFVIQIVIFASFGHWFSNIYVDHVIGAMFTGLILTYLVEPFKTKELLLFIFPLSSIYLVKEVGLYFGFSAVGFYLVSLVILPLKKDVTVLQSLKLSKSNIIFLLGLLAIMILTSLVWSLNKESRGIKPELQSIKSIVINTLSKEQILPNEIENQVKENFWKVVIGQQLHKEKKSLNYNEFTVPIMPVYEKNIKLSTVGVLVFFIIMIVMVSKLSISPLHKRKTLMTGGYLFIVFIVYMVILYMSYLVAFGHNAIRIQSYVRYINIATLPLMMIAFSLLLPFFQESNFNQEKRKGESMRLLASVLTVIILISIVRPYMRPMYTQLKNPFEQQVSPIANIIAKTVPMKSKLFVVFPVRNNGALNNILEYSLIPARATISSSMFSKLAFQEAKAMYKKYDYVWFPILDKQVVKQNQSVLKLKSNNQPYVLYAIEKADDFLVLRPIL